jgi:hypothetical protein
MFFSWGNYEGSYRSKYNTTGLMFAKVLAEKENRYRVIVKVGSDKTSSLGGFLTGKKKKTKLF